jgi:hypothetical protein
MTKRLLLFLFSVLVFVTNSQAQEKNKERERALPISPKKVFLQLQTGLGGTNVRDFATSPLIFSGPALELSFAKRSQKNLREIHQGVEASFGMLTTQEGNHSSNTQFLRFGLYYTYLHRIEKWSSEKSKWSLGGSMRVTSHTRYNSSLMNNGVGFELIPTVFGSAQWSYDISRRKEIKKKLWFVPIHLKKRKRTLNIRGHIGLINSYFRNGYVYAGQSFLLNSGQSLLDHYEFHIFSGFRFRSEVEYLTYLSNNNAIGFSYSWDAYKTGPTHDILESAHHIFALSFHFNTK